MSGNFQYSNPSSGVVRNPSMPGAGLGFGQPASFATAAVAQVQVQGYGPLVPGVSIQEENEFLQTRVAELEKTCMNTREELYQYENTPGQGSMNVPPHGSTRSLNLGEQRGANFLQQRVLEAEELESHALRAHEARLNEIYELEQLIFTLRTEKGMEQAEQEGNQQMVSMYKELAEIKAAEGAARRLMEDQAAKLEQQAMIISESQGQQQLPVHQDSRLDFEQRFTAAHKEKEFHKKLAEQRLGEIQQMELKQARDQPFLDRKLAKLTAAVGEDKAQVSEDRTVIGNLKDELHNATKSRCFHQEQNQNHQRLNEKLKNELIYLQTMTNLHQKNLVLHKKEGGRLKKLNEQLAPAPEKTIRRPLKSLEEKIMMLAWFMMMGVCALPVMGALAALNDKNYMYWMGATFPALVIGGCFLVFVLFALTMLALSEKAMPQHRSLFTMTFTWATFSALLGIMLVPLSLMSNAASGDVAATISQGCLSSLPQSEILVDYSQVLHNIRLTPNCTGAMSVTECKGFSANKYTEYLEYLETNFQCGGMCPENPPPAAAVVAPAIHSDTSVTPAPPFPKPPLLGPPLQNALAQGAAFLQTAASLRSVQLHKQAVVRTAPMSASPGIMDTALPHMQAQNLFSKGRTRAMCYPLIATRLQVLVATFGGLCFWEGIGLIIISLLTSLGAGTYFALGAGGA